MKAINKHRMIVIATPKELREIADTLEKDWNETAEKYPGSIFYTSVTGDNDACVDFAIDKDKMEKK